MIVSIADWYLLNYEISASEAGDIVLTQFGRHTGNTVVLRCPYRNRQHVAILRIVR